MAKGKREKDWVQRPNYHRQTNQRQEDAAMRKSPWLIGDWNVDPYESYIDAPNGIFTYTASLEEQRRRAAIEWATKTNAHIEGEEIQHVIAVAVNTNKLILYHGPADVHTLGTAISLVNMLTQRYISDICGGVSYDNSGRSLLQIMEVSIATRSNICAEFEANLTTHLGDPPLKEPHEPQFHGLPIMQMSDHEFTHLLRQSDEYR